MKELTESEIQQLEAWKKQKEAFLADLFEVYKKHNLAISHEDGHGGFIIEPLEKLLVDWMSGASDGRIDDWARKVKKQDEVWEWEHERQQRA